MDAKEGPPSAPGVISGSSWGSPGTLLSAPGLLWDSFWGAWVCNFDLSSIISILPGSVRRENSEKLEFDDLLNENACFLRSQGLQNEVEILPKRAEERKKSRKSSEKSAQVRRRVSQERSEGTLERPRRLLGWFLKPRGFILEPSGLVFVSFSCFSRASLLSMFSLFFLASLLHVFHF